MRLTWRDYFTPFSNMKPLEGNVRERKEILQHNCHERARVAEGAHRWGQIGALGAVAGASAYLLGHAGWAMLAALLTVASGTAALMLGSVWVGLVVLQRHIGE